jgi:hypothetical protein
MNLINNIELIEIIKNMNIMKKLFISTLLVLGFSMNVSAQRRHWLRHILEKQAG